MLDKILLLAGTAGLAAGLKYFFSDKKIAVVGPKKSGKTVFLEFLGTGDLNKDASPWENQSFIRPIKEQLKAITPHRIGDKEYSFDFENSYEIRNKKSLDDYKDKIKNTDILIYVFDSYEFLTNPEYKDTIREDFPTLQEIAPNIKKIIILANKLDKVFGDPITKESKDEIIYNGFIYEMILRLGGTEKCSIIVGSLSEKKYANKLIHEFIHKID